MDELGFLQNPAESGYKVTDPSLRLRTLRAARDILGNDRALARRLKVSPADLFVWLKGDGLPIPQAVFLKAVDVVLEEQEQLDSQTFADGARLGAHDSPASRVIAQTPTE